ncbi:MAG TPA: creatininase family protein [Nitrososphaeraceae archaeon]|nr:creatininase family protein [Nitrososphaeraceae archaeon]
MTNHDLEKIKKDPIFAIIPVGSLEQHGDHLPVSTDSIIAEYLAEHVSENIHAICLPVLSIGISFEHEPMFNVSLTHQTFSRVLKEICISLIKFGVKDILILNGHHGNMGALHYVSQDVFNEINHASIFTQDRDISENVSINFINYWHLMQGLDHAGEIETSLIMAINPDLVHLNNHIISQRSQLSSKLHNSNGNNNNTSAKGNKIVEKSKIAYASITNTPGSFPKITGDGVWGDPTMASAEKGKEALRDLVFKIEETINDFKKKI